MKKSIEEKVQSLLAKATDPAATESEAETAMYMAQKLMEKHGLSEDDIKAAKARGEDVYMDWQQPGKATRSGKTAIHPVDKYLGASIAKFVGCICYTDNRQMPAATVYFGFEADVEFALYLRSAWIKHFDFHWELYKSDNPRRRDLMVARQSFSVGFAQGMIERLEAWNQKRNVPTDGETGTEVSLRKQDLVRSELANRGIHLSRGGGGTRLGMNAGAAGAGSQAAASASVGRGVGGGVRMIGN